MQKFTGKFSTPNRGFTLIELMIALGVMGILVSISMPSFQDAAENMATDSQSSVLITTLSLARTESVKRGNDVSICATSSGEDCNGGDWSDGWMVFVDANGDADGGQGSVDAGDTVVRIWTAERGTELTFTTDLMQFDNLGYSLVPGIQTFLICPESGNAENARSIEIGAFGRARLIEDDLDCV